MIETGSDFSGVGAFEQAMIRLGVDYKTIFACDIDKYARQTYCKNYGTEEDYQKTLKPFGKEGVHVKPKSFSFYYPYDVYDREIPEKPLDIYMTSPPCQSFSLAGKRGGEDDKRGTLFYNSHEFIIKNNPRYFIFENVKGLLSDDSGRTFQKWVDYLGGKSVNGTMNMFPHPESVNYHVYYKVLNAKKYGVPQNRERIFIIGIRDDSDNHFRFPKEQHLEKRLKDVLEENANEKYYLSDKMINYLIKTPRSLPFTDLDKKEISNCIVSNQHKMSTDQEYIKVKSATKKGYEIASEGVLIGAIRGREDEDGDVKQTLEVNETGNSNAITTIQKDNVVVTKNYIQYDVSGKGYKSQQDRLYYENGVMCTIPFSRTENKVNVLLNDHKIRRLTPRECFRLMDFPDEFKMPCSDTQMYKQAGNSIVVSVLYEILKKLNLKTT